ncbi:MAG: hypothetical protein ABSE93_27460 [Terriglobia bacterium]
MARYFRPIFLILMFLYAVTVPRLPGQSPQPQTYSVTAVGMGTVESMFSGKESTLKIFRRGPKELIDVTIAPWEANPKGIHTINLFDLQAHKVYMRNVTHATCSWMRYVSADMPNYDPIAASASASPADFAKQSPNAITEIVNGIPARIEEVSGPPEQGKARVWIAETGKFIVKMEMTPPNGKPIKMLEVKQVSFAPPLDSYFVTPSNCDTQAQGEMTNTGFSSHAEAGVEAQGTGSANLKTNETHGEVTVRTSGMAGSQVNPPPPRSQGIGATSPQATSRVTDVGLHLVPDHYAGPCPSHVQLVGEITTNGPGTVWYRFLAGAVSHSPEGTMSFNSAGTQTVTTDGTIRVTPRVPAASFIAIMEDAQGNHGPLNVSSGLVNYNITCAPAN